MAIKVLYVYGNGEVVKTGLRVGLGRVASNIDLNIYCRNIDERRVQIVLEGDEKQISTFRSYIEREDVRLFKDGEKYKVTEPKDYDGPPPDWDRFQRSFAGEQMGLGFEHVKNSLEKISDDFRDTKKKFDKIGNGLGYANKRLDSLEKGLFERLDKLTEQMAKYFKDRS